VSLNILQFSENRGHKNGPLLKA